MITKLGRQQFGQQPMILMSVAALRTEHHLRIARSAKITEMILDSFPMCRRPPVRYVENRDLDVGTGAERRQRFHLLGFALGAAAGEHESSHAQPRMVSGQGQAACHPSRSRCRRNAHRRPRFRRARR